MTIKEQCNLEDLYTQYVEDFEKICTNQPRQNDEFDYNDYDEWYTLFTVLQAKKVALEEFAEKLGYRFIECKNVHGYRLEKGD